MRKFLAISIALLLAVIVLTPAMGYTIKSENSSYSIKLGEKANYSIGSGVPAHEITSMPVVAKSSPRYSISSESVAYSFKSTAAPRYSINAGAATTAAVPEVTQPAAQTAAKPAATSVNTTAAAPAAANATAPVKTVAAIPAVSKLSITGVAYEETDNNLAKEDNEMGIEGLKVNLAQPTDTIIANTTTSATGEYSFNNLMPGEYTVTVAAPKNMKVLNPEDGKYTVMLTSKNEANKDFAIESVKEENTTSVAPTTLDKAAPAAIPAATPVLTPVATPAAA